jgi:hypothetical protein
MKRKIAAAAAMIAVFGAVAAAMLELMPAPLKNTDYLMAGSVATMAALLVLFVILITESGRGAAAFFKRRKK